MTSKTPLGESWRAWAALFIGVLAVTAHSATSIVLAVLMKPMVATFGWGRTEFAVGQTTRMLVMVAVISFAGLLTDRIGARFVLAAGAAILAAGLVGLSGIGSAPEFWAVMAFMGPGLACLGSVAASALVLRLFQRRRSIAIGVLNGGDNVINSLVPLGTTAALAELGWRSTLGLAGGVYALLAILIAWALRPRAAVAAAATARASVSLRDLPWSDARLWLVFASYACIYAFITSQQLHLHASQTDLGLSGTEASSILGIQLLVGAVGAPLFGWIAEVTSARAALVAVVAGLAATSTFLWSPHSYAALSVWAVAYGIFNGGAVALLALVLAEIFGAERIGRLMGVAMVFCMSATMLGNLYSASMFDRFASYAPVWRTFTALMVATLVPVVALWRRRGLAAAD